MMIFQTIISIYALCYTHIYDQMTEGAKNTPKNKRVFLLRRNTQTGPCAETFSTFFLSCFLCTFFIGNIKIKFVTN